MNGNVKVLLSKWNVQFGASRSVNVSIASNSDFLVIAHGFDFFKNNF